MHSPTSCPACCWLTLGRRVKRAVSPVYIPQADLTARRQVAQRDKVVFSLPKSLLADNVVSPLATITDPLQRAQSADLRTRAPLMDRESAASDIEADGCNLLQPQTLSQALCPAPAPGLTTALKVFGDLASSSSNMDCAGTDCGDAVFWKPVAGNLHHHTLAGQPMQSFDFLAQTFRPCAGSTDHAHVVPSGAPVAMRLAHVPFERLSRGLQVWKIMQADAAQLGFVHNFDLRPATRFSIFVL